jgi:hypothetical protein
VEARLIQLLNLGLLKRLVSSNIKVERLHNTARERTKVKRGLHNDKTVRRIIIL